MQSPRLVQRSTLIVLALALARVWSDLLAMLIGLSWKVLEFKFSVVSSLLQDGRAVSPELSRMSF